ncbi:hypothetical protein Dimus_025596 [Dionaea muscipula]
MAELLLPRILFLRLWLVCPVSHCRPPVSVQFMATVDDDFFFHPLSHLVGLDISGCEICDGTKCLLAFESWPTCFSKHRVVSRCSKWINMGDCNMVSTGS